MAFFGLYREKRTPLYVVIDPGSHSIKTIFFEKPENGMFPRVLQKRIFKIPYTTNVSRRASRIHEILFRIIKELGRIPEKILIGLGPSFVDVAVELWKIDTLPKKKNITVSDLASYLDTLFAKYRTADNTLLAHQNFSKKNLGGLAYPLEIFVNGYSITPQALIQNEVQEINSIAFRVFTVFFKQESGPFMLDLRRIFGGMPIEFAPLQMAHRDALFFMLARQHSSASLNDSNTRNALLIDIGLSHTLLTLVREGSIAAISVFPHGVHSVISGISQEYAVTFDEAEEMKRHYVQGIAGDGVTTMLKENISKEITSWKEAFGSAVDSFYHIGPIPQHIFVFGGGAYVPELLAFIRSGEWMKGASYVITPDVKILEAKSIFGGDTLVHSLGGPEESGLASLMVYAIHHESFLRV